MVRQKITSVKHFSNVILVSISCLREEIQKVLSSVIATHKKKSNNSTEKEKPRKSKKPTIFSRLTLSFIMLKNDQTYFKKFQGMFTIFQHYE